VKWPGLFGPFGGLAVYEAVIELVKNRLVNVRSVWLRSENHGRRWLGQSKDSQMEEGAASYNHFWCMGTLKKVAHPAEIVPPKQLSKGGHATWKRIAR